MKKNQAASELFSFSSLLPSQDEPSPYLSPFPNHFRKHSEAFDDLIDFKLEEPEDNPILSNDSAEHIQPAVHEERLILQGQNYYQRLDRNIEESEEAASPYHSNHCEIPSTKFTEIKEQYQPPFFLLKVEQEESSQIQAMIEFLVQHSQLKEEVLEIQSRQFCQNNLAMKQIFKILAVKFKKLRKTKQEMTKYCMRKAFKFIAEQTRKGKTHTRDLDNFMKQYCQGTVLENFTVPFKKHSVEKTMNGNFLKRVFSCEQFSQDYRTFLRYFQSLIAQDNLKKIKYLSGIIEQALKKEDIEQIQKIKRLPWTREILKQVFKLAANLPESPPEISNGRHKIQSQ